MLLMYKFWGLGCSFGGLWFTPECFFRMISKRGPIEHVVSGIGTAGLTCDVGFDDLGASCSRHVMRLGVHVSTHCRSSLGLPNTYTYIYIYMNGYTNTKNYNGDYM